MLNLNKCTKKTKPKPKPTIMCTNCSYAYHCAQLSYTTQHRTVLIIFPFILQTIIIAHMISIGGEGDMLNRQVLGTVWRDWKLGKIWWIWASHSTL